MTRILRIVPLCLLVLAAGCSSGLKGQLLGKWEPQELKGNAVVTEISDKDIKTGNATGLSLTSPYRIVDGETIEVETSLFGKTMNNRYKVAITGDEMAWTDANGSTRKFKRLK
jgi:hypothetical protein